MMFLGGLFLIGILAVLAYALGWIQPGNQPFRREPEKSPLDILKERYARGEITTEEYEEMREKLGG